MKYLRSVRNLHLGLGLTLTIFFLVEAITGLILSEPTLIGAGTFTHEQYSQAAIAREKISNLPNQVFNEENAREAAEHAKQISGDVSLLVFVKQLHQGIIGSRNFRWLADMIAVGIIILTVTGVYLSIPLLKVQFKKFKP